MNLRPEPNGFTLIELLVVIAIIGILASIGILQISSYRMQAYHASARSDLANIRLILEASTIENNGSYPY